MLIMLSKNWFYTAYKWSGVEGGSGRATNPHGLCVQVLM